MKATIRVLLAILSYLGVCFFITLGIAFLSTNIISLFISTGFMFLAILNLAVFGYVTITLSENYKGEK